jgi:hypothetical protein
MRIKRSVGERSSAETLAYFVEPNDRRGLFMTTIGGEAVLGSTLRVYEMEETGQTVPATLRHRVLSRHLQADETIPGRFAIDGCKVDIDTTFEGNSRKEKGLAEVDSGVVYELTPPPADQARMN